MYIIFVTQLQLHVGLQGFLFDIGSVGVYPIEVLQTKFVTNRSVFWLDLHVKLCGFA